MSWYNLMKENSWQPQMFSVVLNHCPQGFKMKSMRRTSLFGLTLSMAPVALLMGILNTSLASSECRTKIVQFWELSTSPSSNILDLMVVVLIPWAPKAVPMLGCLRADFLPSTLQISSNSLSSGASIQNWNPRSRLPPMQDPSLGTQWWMQNLLGPKCAAPSTRIRNYWTKWSLVSCPTKWRGSLEQETSSCI